jgi:colanic acid/amylovoran biosynthesis glycosyltransferase
MRILYVVGQFPKLSETFVYNEVLAQMDRGHDVRVVTIRTPERVGLPDEQRARAVASPLPKVPLTPIPHVTPALLRVPERKLSRRLFALAATEWIRTHALTSFRPEVVHAHFLNLPTLIAGMLSTRLRVPYTFMAHSGDYMLKMSDASLRKRILHATAGFAISHVARAEIAARAGLADSEAERLSVVRAAVTLRRGQPRIADPDRPFTIISVARLVPMKGLDTAIRAFAGLRARVPSARYEIVGEGPEGASLRRLAQELEVTDGISFRGALSNSEAQDRMADADVAVLPCRQDRSGNRDGIPVSLMEAGALGLPVVSTRVSGVPELVEHETSGLLLPVDDHDALAAGLVRLAEDPALGRRYGSALQAHVEREFALDLQLDRLHSTWERLLGRHGA